VCDNFTVPSGLFSKECYPYRGTNAKFTASWL